jgi:hypothetical protein
MKKNTLYFAFFVCIQFSFAQEVDFELRLGPGFNSCGANTQSDFGVKLSYEHRLNNISEWGNLFNRGFKLSFHKSF